MIKLKLFDKEKLDKSSIDELTHIFMDTIKEQTSILIDGMDYLIDEKFEEFNIKLNYVIETTTEVTIKKKFESKIFKSKLMFSKADRLKIFSKINDIKNIGEFLANKMLLYKIIFPDNARPPN